MRPGVRVRHPLFGVGTIVRREGTDDDLKLTVSFAGVGAKRLVARYAGLDGRVVRQPRQARLEVLARPSG